MSTSRRQTLCDSAISNKAFCLEWSGCGGPQWRQCEICDIMGIMPRRCSCRLVTVSPVHLGRLMCEPQQSSVPPADVSKVELLCPLVEDLFTCIKKKKKFKKPCVRSFSVYNFSLLVSLSIFSTYVTCKDVNALYTDLHVCLWPLREEGC